MDVEVLYQDPWIIAVDKPQGILVHSDGSPAPTLATALRGQLALQGIDATGLQPLQRLDVDTSGIVLFSLSKETQPAFDALVANREMRKRYLAVASGSVPFERRTISLPLGRDRHDSHRMRVSRGGKPSVTRVVRLACRDGQTLLGVEPLTGRRHQIRVHLSHVGHPLVGDALYGGPSSRGGLMLHAYQLSFSHPVTGGRLALCTSWPQRFSHAFPGGKRLWDSLVS